MRCFHEAGVFTYLNMCLTKDLVRSGDLWRFLRMAGDLNAGAVRLIEPRPCGGYQEKKPQDLFTQEDRERVTDFFIQANTKRKFRDYPMVGYGAYAEAPERFGCMMGGQSHFHIDSRGHVEPCLFLPVSFGNIMEEDFSVIFRRMRKATPRPLKKLCPSLGLAEKINEIHGQGVCLPIPFRAIAQQWSKMYESEGQAASRTD